MSNAVARSNSQGQDAPQRVVVLGGGPAGFFGAIRAAELGADVLLLEATHSPLQKVRISGGGRCNVTQHQFDPNVLVTRYPRGAKELRGALARFGPRETMEWYEAHGVLLKVEPDGRVFPTSDSSETIVECLTRSAQKAGVEVRLGATISSATRDLALTLKDGSIVQASSLLLATGSNPPGLALASSLGHTLVPPVPSLFTFEVRDARLDGLSGISLPHVKARAVFADGTALDQEGPLLITHWGLSAHAVLRLSAWGAREFHASGYRAKLVVDMLPAVKDDVLRYRADALRQHQAGSTLGANPLVDELPRRLWERIVAHAGGDAAMRWSDVPNRGLQSIVDGIKRATFDITGKGPFKEEFVTAGGVARKEVDWRTMESKLVPGLHFAGEVLDVDGLTGGYNFQNSWTTGWLAGTAMGEKGSRGKAP